MTQTLRTVGIDCGKYTLDVAVFPTGNKMQVENTAQGRETLREWVLAQHVDRIGMEASGGYERLIRDLLCQAGLCVYVLSPARVRYFAKAKGCLAKNDTLDAALIAKFTATMDDLVAITPEPDREELARLLRARRLMIDKRTDLSKAMNGAPESAEKAFRHAIDHLSEALASLDKVIDGCRQSNEVLTKKLEQLQSAPGIGPVAALTLAVCVPELGQISNAGIAALLGVAPFAQDSGSHHGQRRIMGGRADARRVLYMATLVAATRVPGVIADFYQHLLAHGKPPKVALTACMRKLIVRLNTMLVNHKTWQTEAA
jgi:transposase